MIDIYDFYDKMEKHNIMLSFKGAITSELLTSILQIMETKLDNLDEAPKTKKKVFNVLVECLQNLYHHIEDTPAHAVANTNGAEKPMSTSLLNERSAIFMIGREEEYYSIITGNFIQTDQVDNLKEKLDLINGMDRDELKAFYKSVLNNGEMSEKGGGGLGMIDIARKSGQRLEYSFMSVDEQNSFFSLNVKIVQ
jgi:hypothetical protein